MTESEKGKTELKDFELEIARCIHCKACTIADAANPKGGFEVGCPAWNAMEWEAYSGGAKMWLARAMLNGNYKIDHDAADLLFRLERDGLCGFVQPRFRHHLLRDQHLAQPVQLAAL